jgi:NAD(P)-dependent dehydrogenase (short-subunit alcohol dehydrogenase family)
MNRLTGKRALITGGTSGIGLETAREFLAEGARVAVTGTRRDGLDAARRELGPDVPVFLADAADIAAQRRLARDVGEAFGRVDALFVNAGVAEMRPLEAWDEAAFDRSMAINFKGPFFLLQALLPVLANPASVVLNTSINARIGMPNTTVYAASKAALSSLIRTLSGELIGRGVRVNAVSPGPITTPLHDKFGLSDADAQKLRAALVAQIPAGRFGRPSEIAKTVVFLASDEASFILGSELVIDGGMANL